MKIYPSHPSYKRINQLMQDLNIAKNPQCWYNSLEMFGGIEDDINMLARVEYQIEHTLALLEKAFLDTIPSAFLDYFDEKSEPKESD